MFGAYAALPQTFDEVSEPDFSLTSPRVMCFLLRCTIFEQLLVSLFILSATKPEKLPTGWLVL